MRLCLVIAVVLFARCGPQPLCGQESVCIQCGVTGGCAQQTTCVQTCSGPDDCDEALGCVEGVCQVVGCR